MISESSSELRSSSRYRIVSRIANGGMGSVYMASQHGAAGFRRVVAIKRAFPHLLEDPGFRKLIASEARLASLVRHPNVVAVSDVEESDGELSIVMEYIEGVSLAELLRGDALLPLHLALRIVLDAAEGLEAIHTCADEAGRPLKLVHRDISPQNILVGVDGVARIADFGIAQTYDNGATGSGVLRGKPAYMAPEYIETSVATPACDVFALAVIMWEALTRHRLFRAANDVETIDRVRAGVVPPPSRFNPLVTSDLDAVILRALAYDPGVRYPSAIAFGQALAAAGPLLPLKARAELGAQVRAVAGPVLAQRRASLSDGGATPVARTSNADLPVVLDPSISFVPTTRPRLRRWKMAGAIGAALALGFVAMHLRGLEASPPPHANDIAPAIAAFSKTRPDTRAADKPPPPVTEIRAAEPLPVPETPHVDAHLEDKPPPVVHPAPVASAPLRPLKRALPSSPSAHLSPPSPPSPPSPGASSSSSIVSAPPLKAPANPYAP